MVFNACYPERHSLGDIAAGLKAYAFPAAREMVLPWAVVMLLAIWRGRGGGGESFAARHSPQDVLPGWLNARGCAKSGGLQAGLRAWIKADPCSLPKRVVLTRRGRPARKACCLSGGFFAPVVGEHHIGQIELLCPAARLQFGAVV